MLQLFKTSIFTSSTLLLGLILIYVCAEKSVGRLLVTRLAILTIVTQLAAFLSPSLLVFNLIVGLCVPIFASKRRFVAPIYLYLVLTMPMVSTLLAVGNLYITTYDVSISLGIGAIVTVLVRPGPRQMRSRKWDWPIVLLFLLLVVQSARDTSASNYFRVVIETSLQTLLPYFVISRSIHTFDDLRLAVFGLISATAALSCLAIFEAFHSWPLYRIVWAHYGITLGSGASVKLRAGFLRAPGPFPEPTSFAFCLAVGGIAAYSMRSAFRNRFNNFAIFFIILLGICAPQSRGAWIGLFVGIITSKVFEKRFATLARWLLFGASAFIVTLASNSLSSRVSNSLGLGGTPDYRVSLFNRGIEEFRKNPVFGMPIKSVLYSLRDITQGEGMVDFVNTYLYVALLSGVVGLTIFVVSVLSPLPAIWPLRARRVANVRDRQQIGFVFSSVTAIAVMLAVTSLGGRTTVMIAIMLGFSAAIMNCFRLIPKNTVVAKPQPVTPTV